jgi:hypothetical protein
MQSKISLILVDTLQVVATMFSNSLEDEVFFQLPICELGFAQKLIAGGKSPSS